MKTFTFTKGYVAIAFILFMSAGCADWGFRPVDASAYEGSDVPKGPGLFSGEQGKFVIFSSEKSKSSATSDKDKQEPDCECKK